MSTPETRQTRAARARAQEPAAPAGLHIDDDTDHSERAPQIPGVSDGPNSRRTPSPYPQPEIRFSYPSPQSNASTQQTAEVTPAATDPLVDEALGAITAAFAGRRPSSKKPELPAFDKKNIDLWIKRVEAAFKRAKINKPGDKFAYLESKIGVDEDPRINEFLFGTATEPRWVELCSYLRHRHSLSKQQRASIVLTSFKRDGRKPSEMFTILKERVGDISVDDIIKEKVVRELPQEVQRSIWETSQPMDGITTSELADTYFTQEGKPIHKTSASNINIVDEQLEHPQHVDEQTDINALGARTPRYLPNADGTRSRQRQRQPKNVSAKIVEVDICRFHAKFGKEARRCLPGCAHYKAEHSPKEQGPRRT